MSKQRAATGAVGDPAHKGPVENELEKAIGRQVRHYRQQLGLSIMEFCKLTKLSAGMMSKIENGRTSPSLPTLRTLANALNIPVTALFRGYDNQRDAVHVIAGQGLKIDRRGTRAGHQYKLLGHSLHGDVTVEPYLITLDEKSEVFPLFQHVGIEFIYVLSGSMTYMHGNSTYDLNPGDSLFFDSDATHGPHSLNKLPVVFLSVMSHATSA